VRTAISANVTRRPVLAGVAVGLLVAVAVGQPVSAAPERPKFQMPFICGERRQGLTYDGHSAGNFALDFNRGSGNDDEGDLFVASASGKVHNWIRPDTGHGPTKIIEIRHNSEWSTEYRHVKTFLVTDGAQVKRGDLIGLVGKTGAVTAHLHYEQQKNDTAVAIRFDGKPLDPPYYNTNRHPGKISNGPTYTSRNC
jgi:hypothetical protein